ncbi:MAG: hypothetical protein K8S62_09000 [Candidatus Sabulitectum sp.]|nr:hypothetical protein [Candidatus Sabulitectum sp.]
MRKRQSPLVRDTDTGSLLELLMVIAVVTILVNRAFLAAVGYPQISPGDLHIAHMLWGGFLMLIALVMVFRYWNPSVRRLAAFFGGMGFGLFIDELGKFVTDNNDYFYKPTIAVIYVIFILMYLLFRGFAEKSELSSRELLVNNQLRRNLGDMHDTSSKLLKWYDAVKDKFEESFDRTIAIKGLVPVLMTVFVFLNLTQLGIIFGLISPGWLPVNDTSGMSIIGIVISGLLVVAGVLTLRRSVYHAFQWFKRSVLVSIFITQIFLFYQSQLTAIWGLAIDLIFYAGIENYLRKKAV